MFLIFFERYSIIVSEHSGESLLSSSSASDIISNVAAQRLYF